MKLKPIGEKIIVERIEPEGKTKGGIVLPDTAKEKPKEGKVIAVGVGKLLENGSRVSPAVKIGDKVIFTSFAGSEVKLDNKEYLIMSEDDVLAIVE
ncbi:MAG: co-chaperone GroES [Planctomycetota bacterium]|nr:co-chaperone GroES [Planctomycetota bacterium]MDI6787376.1 co-chaperone GroES [Planctomycetota bacterium]